MGLVKYYIPYSRVWYLCCRSGHISRPEIILEFGKGNPPCNAEDNLRAGHLVIEAWFRGY